MLVTVVIKVIQDALNNKNPQDVYRRGKSII